MKLINTIALVASWMVVCTNGYLYNPYQQFYRYSYPIYNTLPPVIRYPQVNTPYPNPYANQYSPDQVLAAYPRPLDPPILNVLAEIPYVIKNKFTVVPLVVVAEEDLNIISNPLIVQVSRSKPTMRVKSEDDSLVQCTPAAKVFLDKPLSLYSLKTDIAFPSEIDVKYSGYKIPIQVGAVIVAVRRDQYISPETPVLVHTLYAIPTKPFVIDLADKDDNNVQNQENQSVVVENTEDINSVKPDKNITIVEFPSVEAEPTFQVDEEDDELVNRNPPEPVIPAGIVQSTQPLISTQQFTNSKESPLLTQLREQAAKDRLKNQSNQIHLHKN